LQFISVSPAQIKIFIPEFARADSWGSHVLASFNRKLYLALEDRSGINTYVPCLHKLLIRCVWAFLVFDLSTDLLHDVLFAQIIHVVFRGEQSRRILAYVIAVVITYSRGEDIVDAVIIGIPANLVGVSGSSSSVAGILLRYATIRSI
jgi:hypothetical protein